ncbi:hypothetical protein F442_05621 [Phytophthora nicotianae P10297]|uniref:Uncharacterized protein n=1 Tax=Phytophthora nicotianae P10297 TaxID=1317064 RepID=W2ZMU7_PHYNI|nr:hypothetical protein F442_05621 [Phytophthora nicotianae P10297]
MDSELRTWDLYDLSGAKSTEGVEYGALQESWCAFVRRWNRMTQTGEDFVALLESREGTISEHSLSELRRRICDHTFHDVSRMCYVHVAEGCETCNGPRPTEEDWRVHSPSWLVRLTPRARAGGVSSGATLRQRVEVSLLATRALGRAHVAVLDGKLVR